MAKFSEEITKEICNYLRAGNNQHDSSVLAGINPDTFYTWVKDKPDFSEAIKKAEFECKARNIAFVQKAAENTWQAAAWWLERKYSSEFALKQINELVGKDGQPLTVSIKLDMAGGYIPHLGGITTTPAASPTGPAPVQSSGVAPESKKDNNSNNGNSEAGSV